MAWTDERVELLKKLWADGQSASRIAQELGGVTRNAVIGKIHRLGLSSRANSGDATPKPKVETKRKRSKKPVEADKTRPGSEAESAPVAGADVEPALRNQIIPADQHLPPQPSANEISPEALASHREVQKKALRLGLLDLTERTCKWPIGDPATDDFWFCGLPVEPGKVYCKPCADVAFQPASARRERKR